MSRTHFEAWRAWGRWVGEAGPLGPSKHGSGAWARQNMVAEPWPVKTWQRSLGPSLDPGSENMVAELGPVHDVQEDVGGDASDDGHDAPSI